MPHKSNSYNLAESLNSINNSESCLENVKYLIIFSSTLGIRVVPDCQAYRVDEDEQGNEIVKISVTRLTMIRGTY